MKTWFTCALTFLLVGGCGKGTGMKAEDGRDAAALAAALEALSRKHIYFAHMSVGSNIMDGVKIILAEHPGIGIRLVETKDPALRDAPIFAHSLVSGNGNPQGKIDEFRTVVEKGVGGRVDLAMIKLCFVDVTATTDVQSVFNHYRRVMADLKERHSETTFVHFTLPLTALQVGPKAWIKRILGRPIRGRHDNLRRAEYNEILKREYEGREPVFDLARIEATHPGKGESSVAVDGRVVPALSPDYTDDGGHLNESGRRHVAQELLLFLGNLK